ncbi:tRNA (adenosine(37)-N6)-threonylcarbamoyltransferase complex ATPase subunit type 1 TsaE [Sphingomonas sp. MAH-20]|uniref:tRNA threonylcarbamoyladenosine biosynthesis protein TsaE n=1 Tax=Sphingomonas horti TaxID=2682842 RepID=A0A6I4J1I5_9SPHN|nr:tRNA (adenosine(37)-N6)-threonylcarbamoyltransferase complex ATPase subunit type 1 TsaE [Sphingomonas sp. CGMCC 1.13658]MBA2919589.1 tRNA (adenosine(37)-N6)-threonylcarbamoyltransferase complex ATPase subunit type 1 TsaE [Sphingomonas sp. CGMCC 1.13658]MVO78469.1 tRNA (adenosine(37)-N6)-threonylcarbamoyltransferase complex ATPase subunit type 1 TsaE [Sphingomonas horti]
MILRDEAATLAAGAELAALAKAGDVITLSGELGAGKTTLARGLLAALGLQGEAPSPTFAIVQAYGPPETRLPVAHVDLYRIEHPEEAEELGVDELRGDHLLLVEWPERLGAEFWRGALRLRIEAAAEGGRRLTADVPPSWEARWSPR